MLDLLRGTALLVATVSTGLIAGLYYAYSCSVMPALRRADDRAFGATMRDVNRAILNGWFAAAFAGAPAVTALAAALCLPAQARPALPWAAAALFLHVAGLVVTFAVNVPLNEALDAAPAAGVADREARERFEARWTRWNTVRTVVSTAALACLAAALVTYGGL